MTLRQKQSIFLQNFATLIKWAFEQGYELTAGELYRPDEMQRLYFKQGKTKTLTSQHTAKLAGDLNLFINGLYVTDTAKYAPLGRYWISLHPLNRWGGDWDKDGISTDEKFLDGNHFEMQ